MVLIEDIEYGSEYMLLIDDFLYQVVFVLMLGVIWVSDIGFGDVFGGKGLMVVGVGIIKLFDYVGLNFKFSR